MNPLPYSQGIVKHETQKQRIVVISDLHLGDGRNREGNYQGTENFFADESFGRFLRYLNDADERRTLLIINGDFIDFLRVTSVPCTDTEISNWLALIQELGLPHAPLTEKELRASISKKEKKYGLKTNDYKSVWKLYACSLGHSHVFHSLREWIADGNDILIVKGNHDLEWYWPAVRNYFIYLMRASVQQVSFADDKVILNKQLYLEHGHLYENITYAEGPPTLNNNTELNLSFGAFFNRYLLNKIEIAYPYLDNVRPTTNILPVLIRERFPLALRLLFEYIPFTFKIIPKKQWVHALKYAFTFFVLVVLPIAVTAFVGYQELKDQGVELAHFGSRNDKASIVVSQLKNLFLLVLSYVLGRILVLMRLAPPGSLRAHADEIMKANHSLKIVTFGHTHDPEQKELDGGRYYNTGTWMSVFEVDGADVREDKTYSFLSIHVQDNGQFHAAPLQRWNDDAQRVEPLTLIDKQD